MPARHAHPRLRSRATHIAAAIAATSLLFPALSNAQSTSPSQALQTWSPQLFAAGTLVDAAAAGVAGARLVRPTAALGAVGFRAGDVVVAVDGRRLDRNLGVASGAEANAVFTVLRAVPGERPVLAPEVLGAQALQQFSVLPESARTPMRLARMVANQRTLVRDGVGVVLVPDAANELDSEWLRVANPLPRFSEDALRDVADAFEARTSLGSGNPTETEAARRALDSREYFEARERAARAILRDASDAQLRDDRARLDVQLETYRQASRGVEREEQILTASGNRFGLYVQGAWYHVKENAPQNTLLILDAGNNVSVSAGLRTGLFWSSERGGWPIIRDLHLLTSYGYARHTFHGPPAQAQEGSEPRMRTRSHRISGELMYRPRVLSWLRPHFRGGPAVYHVWAGAYDTDDLLRDQKQGWELGWILGAGIDAYYNQDRRLRLTVVADYQIVSTTFCEQEAPNWIDATNIIELQQIRRPSSRACESLQNLDGFLYKVDLEGIQLGLALAYEF